ncbi:Uncharacterized protein dnm_043350 [Desulfonema magnum]|uniref:Uncharacterized protein n=1 Tax=Desulfonema magnum TaxID=45655 RepID=A0A975BN35_9BACT|nr:Uncharacterized protein dnm_043350 [Desulfonema magnum]
MFRTRFFHRRIQQYSLFLKTRIPETRVVLSISISAVFICSIFSNGSPDAVVIFVRLCLARSCSAPP